MYLRFVVADIDDDSERSLGVFHAARYLRDAGQLHAYEEDLHDMGRWWFNENLERPTRFTAAKAPFYRKNSVACSRASRDLGESRGTGAHLESEARGIRCVRG